jgi:hypothetical protein
LRDELAKLRATLADRESELAKARQDAEQAETEFSRQKTEAELALGRAARKAELDEGKFASLTADLLMRKGEAKSSMLTPPAEFSKAEPDERKFAGLTHGLIVRKGEARPSMIAPPPAESSVSPMSDGRDAPSQHEAKEALLKAETAWKAGEAARLTAAEAQWQEKLTRAVKEARTQAEAARDQGIELELNRLREDCAALEARLADRETALVQAGLAIEQAREGSQHEAKEALSKAETGWKADEAARLAAAEAQWQEKLASAVKEARAQGEAARDRGIELELNRLREECTGLRGTLADRETALVQAGLAIEQAREGSQHEAKEALSKAEMAWKADEAARLAAAEAQWREQSARVLAEVTERCERAETSFAEVSAKADAVATRDQHNEIELRRLREVCAALRAILADRETALAEAGLAIEQAREQWQREAHEALSKAETGWKAGEAARLAAAQTQWQEQSASALAEVTARCQRAETSLAEVSAKADAVAARDPDNEIELRRMREECTGLRAILADREAALAQGGLAIEQARERWQRETQEALSKAETGWKAEEAARLATAEAQWRKQSASALAEMTVRCKRAETSLVEANARADSIVKRDQSNKAEFRRLREELAKTQAALADREVELACARSATDQSRESQTPGTDIVLKPNRIGSIRAIEHREKKASRHLVRDMAVAASLAIATVVLYPYIEPSFPEIGTSSSGPAPAGSSASSAQSPQRAGQRMAVVIHAGNVRAGPSTGAAIVSTLQRGLKVATVEQRGNWTLVRIEDETGDTKPQQGWVYSSFLDAGGSDQESPTAKRK